MEKKKVIVGGAMSLGMRMDRMPKVVSPPPSIHEIYICPEAGAPMIGQREVILQAGIGIVGDRYALGKGVWSGRKTGKIDHVTFISLDEIVKASLFLAQAGSPIFLAHETRRNFVTWDVDLNSLVGKEFSFGEVRFRGTELADPCKRPSALVKKKDFHIAYKGRGGLRAEVLNDGVIKVGDLFALL